MNKLDLALATKRRETNEEDKVMIGPTIVSGLLLAACKNEHFQII